MFELRVKRKNGTENRAISQKFEVRIEDEWIFISGSNGGCMFFNLENLTELIIADVAELPPWDMNQRVLVPTAISGR